MSSNSERIYCSEVARNENAPMQGTAVHVDMWLLLEYPRPWKPKALLENDLPEQVNNHIDQLPKVALEEGIRLRVQFIKQASSADVTHPRAFLADGREGKIRLVTTTLERYSDIQTLQPENLLQGELPGGEELEDELLLVCTNGQRDLCCARFGLPLFEALAFEYGQRVWQTTHVGGHRYAPNLLCLPSGLLYGHVMPDIATDLVASHDEGKLDLAHLRGRSAGNPARQAAEIYVRERLGQSSEALVIKQLDELRFSWLTGAAEGEIALSKVSLGEVLASCGKAPKEDHAFELREFTHN